MTGGKDKTNKPSSVKKKGRKSPSPEHKGDKDNPVQRTSPPKEEKKLPSKDPPDPNDKKHFPPLSKDNNNNNDDKSMHENVRSPPPPRRLRSSHRIVTIGKPGDRDFQINYINRNDDGSIGTPVLPNAPNGVNQSQEGDLNTPPNANTDANTNTNDSNQNPDRVSDQSTLQGNERTIPFAVAIEAIDDLSTSKGKDASNTLSPLDRAASIHADGSQSGNTNLSSHDSGLLYLMAVLLVPSTHDGITRTFDYSSIGFTNDDDIDSIKGALRQPLNPPKRFDSITFPCQIPVLYTGPLSSRV